MNLTQLARKTLESYIEGKDIEISPETKKKLSKKQACFVTLTRNGQLRGCIGSLEARKELYKDIIENTINAAFHDPRFPPLKKEELKIIKIEVSVLSDSKKLGIGEEIFSKINKKMGIILKKGFLTSTFLPQVWEEIPDKTKFLEHLSLKAGLSKDSWKNAEIWYYTVDIERE